MELLGFILVRQGSILEAPGLHFEDPGTSRGSIFSIWQQFARLCENLTKTQVFLGFFIDFRDSESIKIDGNWTHGGNLGGFGLSGMAVPPTFVELVGNEAVKQENKAQMDCFPGGGTR